MQTIRDISFTALGIVIGILLTVIFAFYLYSNPKYHTTQPQNTSGQVNY